MSGETEDSVSGWTTDTLHGHVQRQINDLKILLDERFSAQTKSVDAALASAEKAVSKAEVAAERRFEAVNEFRGQLSDQAGTFLPRSEADARFNAIAEKIDNVTKLTEERFREISRRLDLTQGRSSVWAIIPVAIGAVLGVIGIVAFFNAGT